MKYRRKPIEIEAFQMTLAHRNDNSDWPEWLNQAWNLDWLATGAVFIDEGDPQRLRLYVRTLNGPALLAWNDWIIKGIYGELYPCASSVFEATYDPAVTKASEAPAPKCPQCGQGPEKCAYFAAFCPAPTTSTLSPADVLSGAEEMLRRIAATACLDLDATEAGAIVAELDRLRGAAKKTQPRDKDEEQS